MKIFFSLRNRAFNNALATATFVAIFVDVIIFLVVMPETLKALGIIVGLTLAVIAIVTPLIVIIDIKNWRQDHKNDALFQAVKDDNYGNARLLLRLGADPNARIAKPYENWDPEKSWMDQFEFTLDVVKSSRMKRLLNEHGAIYRTTKEP